MSAKNIKKPTSVLFACSMNAVRSPMAEALAKNLLGFSLFIDSAGVHSQPLDAFAVAVMHDIGIDINAHHTKTFDDIDVASFDLIIALSIEAYERAKIFSATADVNVEFWPIADPTESGDTREQKLHAYAQVRDDIKQRIVARLG